MPPKPKLYNSLGKSQIKNNFKNSPQNNLSMTPEQEQQFQVELYWCINQLQTALNCGKLNNKQVQDHTKALNILMSCSSSVVQKRQVMRLSFGNYREKIAAEEEKASKNIPKVKLKPAQPDKKSLFVKKSMSLSHGEHNFKFNFNVSQDCENCSSKNRVEQSDSNIKQEHNKCNYVPSNNGFRFNFEVSENEK